MSIPPANVQVVPLFSTPVALIEVPQAATLNRDLAQVIGEREGAQSSTQHSNLGGWQSSWDMEQWGGAPAAQLLGVAKQIATELTAVRGAAPTARPTPAMWKAIMWANVNRQGHGNEFHAHPGSFWSGVYYVDDGGIAADPRLGGALEFMDPRGVAPAMYAPNLAFNLPGGLSIGASETIPPVAGRLVLFPAWVLHAVRPYKGTARRISIAFNLNL